MSDAGDALAVETSGLMKRYGRDRALDGLDLAVRAGSVFGFLGPNGAGKTTTLRVLTGLARPTSGTARIFGHDVVRAADRVRALIGYLPDVPGFYDWMTAPEFLRFAGSLFGLSEPVLGERVVALLDLAGLTGVTTRVGGFSRGMKQRLGIAQALINAPRLLLLDEPTSALDPIGRKEVLDMIAAMAGRMTVFFSTHILADVERVCDTVAILNRGRVVSQSSLASLRTGRPERVVIAEVSTGAQRLAGALSGAPWLTSLVQEGERLRLAVTDIDAAEHAVPAAVAQAGLGLRRLESSETTLEEVFVELVGDKR